MKKPPSASPCEVRAGWAPPQAQGEGPPEGDKSDPGSPLPPQPGASLGRVAAVHPLSLKKASQDTEGQVTAHFIAPTQASSLCPSYLLSLTCSPVLFMVDDAASLSLSLFLRLPFPVPSALSQPPHPPRVDQTQTQLEHARIGELEQSLLLEKAQAERLLRELADNRVTRLSPLAGQRPGLLTPLGLLCFIIFSVLGCYPHFFYFCSLCRREVEVLERAYTPLPHDAYWGGWGLGLCDFAP